MAQVFTTLANSVSPPSRVLNCLLAAGPEPAFVLALILIMYSVMGLSLDILTEVSFAETSKICVV